MHEQISSIPAYVPIVGCSEILYYAQPYCSAVPESDIEVFHSFVLNFYNDLVINTQFL